MLECPDGTSAFIPDGGGGGNNPPPPTGNEFDLCWLNAPPPADQILNQGWYLQKAEQYRNNSSSLSCMPLGTYQEWWGPELGDYFAVVCHSSTCYGTVNLVSGDGMRVVGAVATGAGSDKFDQIGGVTVGVADPGGVAIVLVMQGGINVWVN